MFPGGSARDEHGRGQPPDYAGNPRRDRGGRGDAGLVGHPSSFDGLDCGTAVSAVVRTGETPVPPDLPSCQMKIDEALVVLCRRLAACTNPKRERGPSSLTLRVRATIRIAARDHQVRAGSVSDSQAAPSLTLLAQTAASRAINSFSARANAAGSLIRDPSVTSAWSWRSRPYFSMRSSAALRV